MKATWTCYVAEVSCIGLTAVRNKTTTSYEGVTKVKDRIKQWDIETSTLKVAPMTEYDARKAKTRSMKAP